MSAPSTSRTLPLMNAWKARFARGFLPRARRCRFALAALAAALTTCAVAWSSLSGPAALASVLALDVVIVVSVVACERDRSAERAAAVADRLALAELEVLRARLHPHFLFNALHTVRALVREGRHDEAARALVQMGDLLRRCLQSDGEGAIPLAAELHIVHDYLDLERLRYGDRLELEEDVDPSALGLPVPAMTLQLLVENAVRHGALATRGRDRIVVRATRCNDHVELSVRNRVTPGAPSAAGFGLGLQAVRRRLERLAPGAAQVDVEGHAELHSVHIRLRTDALPFAPVPLPQESAA